ncbi:MAG: hypothetical protein V1822_01255 [Candidatus Micrarchaeota archaeon]
MAQIEQKIAEYLNKNPHIRLSYAQGLINRRALARKIIDEDKSLSKRQFQAAVAALRRADLQGERTGGELPQFSSILIKDGITIANLSKSRDALSQIEKILPKISYEKNQTFKIVMGSESIKLFLDSKNQGLIDVYIQKKDIIYARKNMAEISLAYPQEASSHKGILSYLTTSLALHEIAVEEFLTCSPELLLYVDSQYSLKAYELLKSMQKK